MRLLAILLSLLLLLFMANHCVGASGRGMVVVFEGDQTEVPFEEDNGTITQRKPRAFRLPVFVGGIFYGKEFLVLLCDARYNGFADWSFIEPAAKTSYGDYTKWSDVEIVVKDTRKSKTHSVVGEFTAVMKGNKIYVLAPSWDESKKPWVNHQGDTGWDPLMIVGTVMNRTESEGTAGVFVKWEKQRSLKSLLPNTVLGAPGFRFFNGVGNSVVTKSGTIVIPIQIANNRRQYASSIIYSTDDGSTWHIGGTTEEGTSECSVTEWGNGKLLLSARYERGYRKVYESDDMGATWKEFTMFSQMWGNKRHHSGLGSHGNLIAVPVDGKDVLLFAHQLNKRYSYTPAPLQLWMSDGQRIKCVGTISEDGKEENSGYSILAHVGDHLYIVHKFNAFINGRDYNAARKEWDRVIALTPLQDLFDSVKNTARAWRKVDAELQKIHVPTNGLVGFLSDSNDDTVWKDKYNFVNATVKGATWVEGGFRFDGTRGSGAQWPVQSQGQNQFCFFTEKQFTLAATVTIHTINGHGNHWLLGASEEIMLARELRGLAHKQNNGWYVLYSGGWYMNYTFSFDPKKDYHVAMTYAKGTVNMYVDGVSIMNGEKGIYKGASISNFYIGGIMKSKRANGILCTVKNVMLFNRVLNQTEVDKIKNVDKYVDQNEPMIVTEQMDIGIAPTSASTTKHTDTMVVATPAPKTPLNETVKDSKAPSTMDSKETSDPGAHIIPFDDENDESEEIDLSDIESSAENLTLDKEVCDGDTNDVQHHSNDRDYKKGHKRADKAVGSISFTTWMFLAYSAIALAVL